MKKYVISLMIVILVALVATFAHFVVSFLLSQGETDDTKIIGEVKVVARAYYEENGVLYPASEVELAPGNTKKGIFYIDVVDSSALAFFENFRIYIDIYSSVDTYFRVQIYEQLTLTISNIDGGTTELAVLMEQPMDFNYEQTNWYHDLRATNGYIYYMQPIQRVSDQTPLSVGLIASYYPDAFFSSRPIGYSLQLAIVVEAVQAYGGPENNWGMETPPWGGEWS